MTYLKQKRLVHKRTKRSGSAVPPRFSHPSTTLRTRLHSAADVFISPCCNGQTRDGLLAVRFLRQMLQATSAACCCGSFQPVTSFSISDPVRVLLLNGWDYTFAHKASQASIPRDGMAVLVQQAQDDVIRQECSDENVGRGNRQHKKDGKVPCEQLNQDPQ